MKKIAFIFALAALVVSCNKNHPLQITVSNPSDFDRTTEMIEIPLDSIQKSLKLKDTLQYVVKDEKGTILTSQMTYDRKFIFQSGLKAHQTGHYTIELAKHQQYNDKTYGRLVSERYDDFAWENDRVAFRIYGPALIKIDGPSNGLDLWFKRTSNLIINKWYKNDIAGKASYHVDHGEGMDGFDVGRSLGAGAMAPYLNGKLCLNDNYTNETLFETGPLRVTFKLTYKPLDINGKPYMETRLISLDAGSQLTKIVENYDRLQTPIQVAAGFSVHNPKNTYALAPDKSYLAYTENLKPEDGQVYLGLVFPNKIDSVVTDTYKANDHNKGFATYKHVLALTTYKKPITYYSGYGWTKFGFADRAAFETYLDHYAKALQQPLVVKYNYK